MTDLHVNQRLIIPSEQLSWQFSRSSGPGGQNVNKVNSKATLRWRPVPSVLGPGAHRRFLSIARQYLTSDGEIVIHSQEFRDQPRNVETCRNKLAELIRKALIIPKRRIKTKPTKSSQRRRLDGKRRQSEKKRSRQGRDFD